ncbi:SDR family NAD(P)-dependent oxidoreductase [Nocardia gamkensis]|uniref:SDR family NAD(P)-dependent oxidoreductase n=1 Tax=Nocardia gamkensis TaxID=352869 RepID=A0A7X6L0W4_9NOCA|nr:SDR family NAD(P)-dependent oxidoreductase [Nocardia gamkensis]NKY25768.1 SDR family NAD(P)-dependent oxidoreductase [Nocardia gamkensis]NQE69048.1 putative oxidoreductase YxjF [Nocardia gamkensis]
MRTALITGSGRREGLGFETARQLGAQGFHVILSARRLEQVKPLAAELTGQGIAASTVQLDLLDPASAAAAKSQVETQFGKLEVLVNNAAMLVGPADVADKDMDELLLEFQTNVVGTWSVTQQFLPLLVTSGHGRIVNVSSGAGSFWDPDHGLVNFPGFTMARFGDMPIPSYALTKAALNGLTIKMAKELERDNILVNSVCPGMTATHPGPEGFARPVADSAKGIVWAATLPDGGPTGLFFRDGKQLPW